MTVAKIWRKIPEYYNLVGKRCTKCKTLYFPGRYVCRECDSEEMEDYMFSGKGRIVTFTVIRTPNSDLESLEIPARNIPYIMAIVELTEGPRLTAEIVDCEIDDAKIGSNVEVVFRKICEKSKNGVIQYGYKFRLT